MKPLISPSSVKAPTLYNSAARLGRLLLALLFIIGSRPGRAYELDPNSPESAKFIAKQMADDMLLFYHGDEPGHVPGLVELPYYWWYGGAMFGALVDYWYYTGDASYNTLTTQGLLFQTGDESNYMPVNQTRTEGNDDQGFWGLAVMSAAELNYPNPPPDQPQWLALAQAVFNTQAARWDEESCGGGLRWQIFTWNKGFDYKNSISQACFFALGARLALFTGNASYAEWAERVWEWTVAVDFISPETFYVYDGAAVAGDCRSIVPYQWTYNAGGFILGAAAMYNFTGSPEWRERLDRLLAGAAVFFVGPGRDVMSEVACEPVDLCNSDQQSFKAYLSRWMAAATKWAPHTHDGVMAWLEPSAVAAARQCAGGDNGRMCGLKWTGNGTWDGTTGLGQQMAAMEVVLSTLIRDSAVPFTHDTGGTSVGDPSAGGVGAGRDYAYDSHFSYPPLSAADRAGAVLLTVAMVAGLIGGVIFVLSDDDTSDGGSPASPPPRRPPLPPPPPFSPACLGDEQWHAVRSSATAVAGVVGQRTDSVEESGLTGSPPALDSGPGCDVVDRVVGRPAPILGFSRLHGVGRLSRRMAATSSSDLPPSVTGPQVDQRVGV